MPRRARQLIVTGQVQGVGFRPFVHRLASAQQLCGWVRNTSGQVEIRIEGEPSALAAFAQALISSAPPLARPKIEQNHAVTPQDHPNFRILDSQTDDAPDIHLPVDHFVCDDCLAEIRDPDNRRFHYPFTNCTQCGPRYTLIQALPYDRANTAMASFALCQDCAAEYADPNDRRFHAEPIACPQCGPHLQWHPGNSGAEHFAAAPQPEGPIKPGALPVDPPTADARALEAAILALRQGAIVAVKGVGGYHLLCDARQDAAIARLRARKPRPRKPLAVMFADLEMLHRSVKSTPALDAFLSTSERPILLLPKRDPGLLSALIAPNLDEIGCLLPYSPLHALLLEGFGGPLIATSGNISGEPVLTDAAEAETRLARVADAFLHQDRPILRPADDSVYRPIAGSPRPIRLGRGRAPLELRLPHPLPQPVLALGSHMKNNLCLAWNDRAVLSPHIGELDSVRSRDILACVAEELQALYQVQAERLLLDRHPGYGYRAFARGTGLPIDEIWHHQAHAAALAWEFPEVPEWILFSWDGVGLGEDGSLWGGETFVGRPGHWRHVAGLRPFRLPGGDKAGRQPWRSAVALLWETRQQAVSGSALKHLQCGLATQTDQWPLEDNSREFSEDAHADGQITGFAQETSIDLGLLYHAWERGLNAPRTSAAGRLFDAAAALIGLCSEASFEGEGPMRLETLATRYSKPVTPIDLPLHQDATGLWRTDWGPLLEDLCDQRQDRGARAARFHHSLALALLQQARQLRKDTGIRRVGLTGGVFQNRLLTETLMRRLDDAGFHPHIPKILPVNDAAISLGQVIDWLYRNANPDSPESPS